MVPAALLASGGLGFARVAVSGLGAADRGRRLGQARWRRYFRMLRGFDRHAVGHHLGPYVRRRDTRGKGLEFCARIRQRLAEVECGYSVDATLALLLIVGDGVQAEPCSLCWLAPRPLKRPACGYKLSRTDEASMPAHGQLPLITGKMPTDRATAEEADFADNRD